MIPSNQNPELSPLGLYRIRFQDCDPFGHLNNSRYIDYVFDAREDHLRTYYNFDLSGRGKSVGRSWVVAKTKVAYLNPCLWNETIQIMTRLIEVSDGKLRNEAMIYNLDGTKLKAVLWVDFVYVDISKGRPVRHEPELKEFLESILYLEENLLDTNFEDRVNTLKKIPIPAIQDHERRIALPA